MFCPDLHHRLQILELYLLIRCSNAKWSVIPTTTQPHKAMMSRRTVLNYGAYIQFTQISGFNHPLSINIMAQIQFVVVFMSPTHTCCTFIDLS